MKDKKFKIVHISENIRKSSVPYRQMIAFKRVGIDSEILTHSTSIEDAHIHIVQNRLLTRLFRKVDSFFVKIEEKRYPEKMKNTPFSYFHVGYDLANDKMVRDADIIIIHWIGASFLSPHGIKKILELDKPVILVCHDNGNFTGGCHVRMGCEKYKSSCGFCPFLKSNKKKDMSFKLLKSKKKAFSRNNLVVVSPSKWMDDNVESSAVLKGKEHYIIPNPIDTDVFKPLDKKKVREKYGINPNHLIILFGGVDVSSSPSKGYRELFECLRIFTEKYHDAGKIDAYIFGSEGESIQFNDQITLNYLGYLDENEMVEAYNLADIYVVSSLEDSFNNTVAEALATETPVVSFEVGGIVDIIDSRQNGYLAKAVSPEDLADGIFWVKNHNPNNKLGKNGREKVLNKFTYEKVAGKYSEIFDKLKDNSSYYKEVEYKDIRDLFDK